MTYKVQLTRLAKEDIREHSRYMRVERQSPVAARTWVKGLRGEIAKLRDLADKFDVIPEGPLDGVVYRSFGFYSHRVIYEVATESRIVYVHRVYHGARQPLKPSDLQDFNL